MSVIEAFVIDMRHELRTPVNAILGYSQLLLEEHGNSLTAEACHDLERMIEAGHQLLRIVSESLDVVEPSGDDLALCAARMRHSLHTPLTSVQGLAYLLIEEHQGTPICDDLRRIDAAAVQLAEVSDSLEDAYRVRLGAARDGSLPAPSTAPLASASPEEPGDRSGARRGSILVIDDEEINRDLLTRRLTHQGHLVMTADSGEEGLAFAARAPVDLILLDVLMPGLSGYEVLSKIKADATLREIPVLMISALDRTASVTRCIALGADDYLTKPFDPLVLRARVSSCLRKKWARDFELAYLRGVEQVTAAALAVEAGRFTPDSLDHVGTRSDALGNLARLFQRMGVEVAARECRLRAQVEQLVIAIDEERKAAQVAEITESDYFQKLKARAKVLVARNAARTNGSN
jgi:DNA-binding response OmpR family regulator